MKQWIQEFGAEYAIPAEIETLVDAGVLADASWHNDLCPKFEMEVNTVRLLVWVEALNPAGPIADFRELVSRRLSEIKVISDRVIGFKHSTPIPKAANHQSGHSGSIPSSVASVSHRSMSARL
jgi:hypothetical protein